MTFELAVIEECLKPLSRELRTGLQAGILAIDEHAAPDIAYSLFFQSPEQRDLAAGLLRQQFPKLTPSLDAHLAVHPAREVGVFHRPHPRAQPVETTLHSLPLPFRIGDSLAQKHSILRIRERSGGDGKLRETLALHFASARERA